MCAGGAISLLVQRKTIDSALSLIVVMGSLAMIYLLLGAEFVAVIQLIVYAGAIMVLFLFVIMLLNVGRAETTDLPGWLGHVVMLVIGGIMAAELWAMTRIVPVSDIRLPAGTLERMTADQGAIQVISGPLFREYLVPFEITSVLLLAAVVGAVVLAKRRL
jgi:NADH-quinone oxidoreductase subunit J